jgi:hypothetical protein
MEAKCDVTCNAEVSVIPQINSVVSKYIKSLNINMVNDFIKLLFEDKSIG